MALHLREEVEEELPALPLHHTQARPRRTDVGYRRLPCRSCGRKCNQRTATPLASAVRCVTSARRGTYPGAIRLEFGPTVPHRTMRYAHKLLEQSPRTLKHRLRPMLGFNRFASAARCWYADDEVLNCLRFEPVGGRPAP